MRQARELEAAYLESGEPERQAGFSGGRERWVAERSPLIEAIDRDGSFLDVGCANGLLAQDVVAWTAERGHSISPFGIDLGPGLVELARERVPEGEFYVADLWTWEPDRQWTYVYSLLDLTPDELQCEWLRRLLGWIEPDGRLIIGSYGGRTPHNPPVDVAGVLKDCGLGVVGESSGGDPVLTRFAWTET